MRSPARRIPVHDVAIEISDIAKSIGEAADGFEAEGVSGSVVSELREIQEDLTTLSANPPKDPYLAALEAAVPSLFDRRVSIDVRPNDENPVKD